MSQDPWMEDGNSLDLTDSAEDRVHVPLAFTRDHAEWLTADDQANFANVSKVKYCGSLSCG